MTLRWHFLFVILFWMPVLLFCADSLFSSSPLVPFPVAYQRIEINTALTLSQSLNVKYTIPPATQREQINTFITTYPDLSAYLWINDVVESYPFEFVEKYYLNSIYLGTFGNIIYFRLTPSQKHVLQFTIPLHRWEPAVNTFIAKTPYYLSYPFLWSYKNVRKVGK